MNLITYRHDTKYDKLTCKENVNYNTNSVILIFENISLQRGKTHNLIPGIQEPCNLSVVEHKRLDDKQVNSVEINK